jgi:hypothetical protein
MFSEFHVKEYEAAEAGLDDEDLLAAVPAELRPDLSRLREPLADDVRYHEFRHW